MIDIGSRLRVNQRPTRFVSAKPVKVDDGLDNIGWTRGLGGERLPAASSALVPNL